MSLGRRGFTLLEILIGLVLAGVIGLAITRTMLQQQRAGHRMIQRVDADRVRGGSAAWLTAELADLGRDSGSNDVHQMGPDELSYRAYRSSGVTCAVTPMELRLLASRFSGWRMPQPGRDSLLLYLGRDSASGGNGRWLAAPITSVGASSCAGLPAIALGTLLDSVLLPDSLLFPFLPVRTFEMVQSRFYLSQAQWWLGTRSVSAGEGLQPVFGPFEASPRGFRFGDGAGNPAVAPATVRRIVVQLGLDPLRLSPVDLALWPWNLQ